MNKANTDMMDPVIEGYLGYLLKVARRHPRTVIDVRCTLRRAISRMRPGVPLWRFRLEDYLYWLEEERQSGCTETSLAKYLSHLRGLLDYAWRSGKYTSRHCNTISGKGRQRSRPVLRPSMRRVPPARSNASTSSRSNSPRRRPVP